MTASKAPAPACGVTASPKKKAPNRIPKNGTIKLKAFARDRSMTFSALCHNQKASAVPKRLRPKRLAMNSGWSASRKVTR